MFVLWFVWIPEKMAKFLDQEPDIPFYDVHEVIVPHLGHIPIAKGDFNRLPKKAQKFIAYYVSYNWNIFNLQYMLYVHLNINVNFVNNVRPLLIHQTSDIGISAVT